MHEYPCTMTAKNAAKKELATILDPKLFRVLSEPVRIEILKCLMAKGRMDVGAIAQRMPQDGSVISRHLGLMQEVGLLTCEKEGRYTYYEINGPYILERLDSMARDIRRYYESCCPERLRR
jgi:DNA-binding transcriptional ArsR family regulator